MGLYPTRKSKSGELLVPKNTKQLLEQINEVSRQLLSRILTVKNNIQEDTVIINESNSDESITDHALTELMSKRSRLINCLFEQKITGELAKELSLVNEMVSLDSQLSSQSQKCKDIYAEQIIRLKKRKKASKSYQKY